MKFATHWENPLELLEQRCHDGWLMAQNNQEFWAIAHHLYQEFRTLKHQGQPLQSILLAESNPLRFLAGFFAAHATVHHVFLGNPQWGTQEWQQAIAIAQPDYIWGDIPIEAALRHRAPMVKTVTPTPQKTIPDPPDQSLILIPTGGSSGQIRFVMHRWDTLAAAVTGFQQYFQLEAINSICVLPLYHVSGLMQVMRSLLSGGNLWLTPFKSLKQGQNLPFSPQDWCISLVPTQLQALLRSPPTAQWLAQCHTVFIGGAAPWPDLLHQSRTHHIPVGLCYGMTETAAQFTALKPQDFLAGQHNVGQVFSHAQVLIVDEIGKTLPPHTMGQVCVAADSLALGYYPTGWSADQITTTPAGTVLLRTDDGGYFDDNGHLNLVGRLSNKIITGGENVFPAEVEAAIWATGLVMDVAVVGIPDAYWGQCVAAVYVPQPQQGAVDAVHGHQRLATALHHKIARYKQPKLWVPVEILPRNEQGKINRQQLAAMCLAHR
ncbi:MAG: 2-succinylbenzoate--CoA ligase [Cyanothece sp. SIO2G6]|nr:2-succinylbenzoate--CoA ligase [Cyanothece sp. SIO2G6]